MADGDEIHQSMRYRYVVVMKQVCEGHMGPREIASRFAKALAAELGGSRYKGVLPAIQAAAAELTQTCQVAATGLAVDWSEVRRHLKRNLEHSSITKKIYHSLEYALERVTLKLEAGERPASVDDYIVSTFVGTEFRGEVCGKGPVDPQRSGVPQGVIDARMETILQFMEPYFDAFGRQAAKQKSFGKLRCASMHKHLPRINSTNVHGSIEELLGEEQ